MTTALSKYKSAQAELRHAKAELKQWRDKEFPVGTIVNVSGGGSLIFKGTVTKHLADATQVLVQPKQHRCQAVKCHVRDIERVEG